MGLVSMDMLKYIYTKNEFKYYDATSIAEIIGDNLFKKDSILCSNEIGKFNIITIDEYYYIPKSAVLSKYIIDTTGKNIFNQNEIIQRYRDIANEKVMMRSV